MIQDPWFTGCYNVCDHLKTPFRPASTGFGLRPFASDSKYPWVFLVLQLGSRLRNRPSRHESKFFDDAHTCSGYPEKQPSGWELILAVAAFARWNVPARRALRFRITASLVLRRCSRRCTTPRLPRGMRILSMMSPRLSINFFLR